MNKATSTPSKRGRPGYEREELLRICVAEFNAHGYEATSMGALASTLGITKSAIYHHVSSKEEILNYALSKALDSLEEVFDAAESLPSESYERLEFAVRQTVFVLAEQLENVTLLLRLRGNSPLEQEAAQRRRELTYRLSDLVLAAQQSQEIRDFADSRTIARLIFGMINSLTVWYKPGGNTDVEQLADEVVEMAFKGIAQ